MADQETYVKIRGKVVSYPAPASGGNYWVSMNTIREAHQDLKKGDIYKPYFYTFYNCLIPSEMIVNIFDDVEKGREGFIEARTIFMRTYKNKKGVELARIELRDVVNFELI